MNTDQFTELDLRRFAAVLRRRAAMITVLVVVAFVGVYLFTTMRPDLYAAQSEVRVSNAASTEVFGGRGSADSDEELATEIHLVLTNRIRLAANEQLGEVADDVTSVTANRVEETDIMQINVSATSPEAAKQAADTYAAVYVRRRQAETRKSYEERAAQLEQAATEFTDQIREIDQRLASGSVPAAQENLLVNQRTSFQSEASQYRGLASEAQVQANLRAEGITIVEEAQLPTIPFAPRPLREATLAAVVALVLGSGLAILLDRLNTRVSNAEDVELLADGIPVIGSIPIVSGPGRHLRQALSRHRQLVKRNSPSAEAYRTLQTSLRFSSLGKTKQRIAITSSSGGEGKTTVTANLAMVLAESGLRVVVVSADLRRPMIGDLFGIEESEKGLTSVLLGDAPLADCLMPVTFESGRSLYVLPSGPLPHNPAELLGSAAFGTLLERIEAAGVDFILLDCAPVLPVADPLAVAQHVDGMVVLALADRTKQRSLSETLERLRKVEADIIGVVLNGVPNRQGTHYPYYGFRHYGTPSPATGKDVSDADAPTGTNGASTAVGTPAAGGPGGPSAAEGTDPR
jgi:capsular exopolysaccharide synthesis family protein